MARTFLTIVAAGSFLAASDRLHVAQFTVSLRIQALEDFLGPRLFVHNKAGTTLIPACQQFEKHASILVRTVEQARHDVGVPRGLRASVTVDGGFGLWEHLLLWWLPIMRRDVPEVSLRGEVGFEADLMQGPLERRINIAVMYTPQSRPRLKIDQLLEEELVFVGAGPTETGA